MKIFILEDDPERILWFKKTFGDAHELDITLNVDEACEWLASREYGLIFLDRDISHPVRNGEEVSWFMRVNEIAPLTPVIVHSLNPRGQRVMPNDLKRYHRKVFQIPFTVIRQMHMIDIIAMVSETRQ